MTKYRRKPDPVDAEQMQRDGFMHAGFGVNLPYHFGEWVVRWPSGTVAVMTEHDFRAQYEPIEEQPA